jgi:hypothetical protein
MSQSSEDLIFYIEHDKTNICEFDYHFPKSLSLDNYRCALLECNLPKTMKIDKFKLPKKLFLNCIWIPNFNIGDFEISVDMRLYHKQTNDDFKDMVFEYSFGPGIYTEEEFLQEYQKIDFEPKIKTFYESRFKDAYSTLTKDYSIVLPSIQKKDNKIFNKIGTIKYTGLFKHDRKGTPKYIAGYTTNKEKNIKLHFDDFPSLFAKHRVAWLYFTFDEALHKILGFDPNDFPVVKMTETLNPEGSQYILHYPLKTEYVYIAEIENGGFAKFKSQFNFEMIYLHSNIVKESYILNKKANILRVFSRKTGSQRNIVHYSFEYPVFLPLRYQELSYIYFKVTNEYDEIPTFDEGFISLKVIFKSALL